MATLKVKGGSTLYGKADVQGSKNAILPMLAASVLCKEPLRIKRCPKISDVYGMISLLESIGCKVYWEENDIIIDPSLITSNKVTEHHARVMRSSIILAGAMLGREGKVEIFYPGGCSIGARPINLHLNAFRQMNVTVTESDEMVTCETQQLSGSDIELDFPSVGATENILLAAVLADGVTTIQNAAKEPEIIELCRFLKSMGAKITGEGTATVVIKGVSSLHTTEYQTRCDRIVFGTYLAAVAGAGGEIEICGNCASELEEVFLVYRQMGVEIRDTEHGIYAISSQPLKKADLIRTRPYPGFPTDLQSQTMAVLTKARGTSIMIENLFEGRFKTADELVKMGADIYVDGRAAIIKGGKKLHGEHVLAFDLRGGAALLIAGLMAEGTTTIQNYQYIERGYEDIAGSYQKLNASVELIDE